MCVGPVWTVEMIGKRKSWCKAFDAFFMKETNVFLIELLLGQLISEESVRRNRGRKDVACPVPLRWERSSLNLSLSQQENTQTLGTARFKPSAGFIHVKTKRYMPYHRNVIYNPSNIQLQKTRSQAKLNWNGVVEQQLGEKPPRTSTCT